MVKESDPSNPSTSFMSSIVRIKGTKAIGLGFLVDDTHIITCAHVVKDVLNLDDYPSEAPSDKVIVVFPYVDATELTAHVLIWHPGKSDGSRINDIAVLVLADRKPKAALPAPLLRPLLSSDELLGHTFLAFGYPAKHPSEGIWSHGKMVWPLPNGLLQIENLPGSKIPIERGFSGTPVWDEELNGLVGMVVAASLRKKDAQGGGVGGEGIAFVIPIDVLVVGWSDLEKIAWPESKEIVASPASALNNKGISLDILGRYDEAITCYDKALAINPLYSEAWYNKGISLANLKRYDEAITCYDKALAINPRYASAWNNKGISLQKLGRHEEAIACFEKANALRSQT